MGTDADACGAMHISEVATDVHLVRRLLAERFPEWSALALSRVDSAGTDNALYRLGEDMVVRLPRVPWASEQIGKEQRFLPRLAPALPLAVSVPLAKGRAGGGYPREWGVYRWLEGTTIVAWNLLPARARAVFREALAPDEATWARGRGWALSTSVIALACYRHTNLTLSAIARQALHQLLDPDASTRKE